MKLESESKYASDGSLYAPSMKPMSYAHYIVYGYMNKSITVHIFHPYNVGRNKAKRKARAMRKELAEIINKTRKV